MVLEDKAADRNAIMGLQSADFLAREHAVGDEGEVEIFLFLDPEFVLHQVRADLRFGLERGVPVIGLRIRRLARNLRKGHTEGEEHALVVGGRLPRQITEALPNRGVHLLVNLRCPLEEQLVQTALVQGAVEFLLLVDICRRIGAADRAGVVLVLVLSVDVRAAPSVPQLVLAQQIGLGDLLVVCTAGGLAADRSN